MLGTYMASPLAFELAMYRICSKFVIVLAQEGLPGQIFNILWCHQAVPASQSPETPPTPRIMQSCPRVMYVSTTSVTWCHVHQTPSQPRSKQLTETTSFAHRALYAKGILVPKQSLDEITTYLRCTYTWTLAPSHDLEAPPPTQGAASKLNSIHVRSTPYSIAARMSRRNTASSLAPRHAVSTPDAACSGERRESCRTARGAQSRNLVILILCTMLSEWDKNAGLDFSTDHTYHKAKQVLPGCRLRCSPL